MHRPPLGYDDETIIPQERLKQMISQLELHLENAQQMIESKTVPVIDFQDLRAAADELEVMYRELVESIIASYEAFQTTPEQSKVDDLYAYLSQLKDLLT